MRIALAQTEPLWEAKHENFRRAERFLKEASEKKSRLYSLPGDEYDGLFDASGENRRGSR